MWLASPPRMRHVALGTLARHFSPGTGSKLAGLGDAKTAKVEFEALPFLFIGHLSATGSRARSPETETVAFVRRARRRRAAYLLSAQVLHPTGQDRGQERRNLRRRSTSATSGPACPSARHNSARHSDRKDSAVACSKSRLSFSRLSRSGRSFSPSAPTIHSSGNGFAGALVKNSGPHSNS
jgi:hypothetical protein